MYNKIVSNQLANRWNEFKKYFSLASASAVARWIDANGLCRQCLHFFYIILMQHALCFLPFIVDFFFSSSSLFIFHNTINDINDVKGEKETKEKQINWHSITFLSFFFDHKIMCVLKPVPHSFIFYCHVREFYTKFSIHVIITKQQTII